MTLILTLNKLRYLLANPTNLDPSVNIIMLWAVPEFIQTVRSMLIELNEDMRLEVLFLYLVVSIWTVPRFFFWSMQQLEQRIETVAGVLVESIVECHQITSDRLSWHGFNILIEGWHTKLDNWIPTPPSCPQTPSSTLAFVFAMRRNDKYTKQIGDVQCRKMEYQCSQQLAEQLNWFHVAVPTTPPIVMCVRAFCLQSSCTHTKGIDSYFDSNVYTHFKTFICSF